MVTEFDQIAYAVAVFHALQWILLPLVLIRYTRKSFHALRNYS